MDIVKIPANILRTTLHLAAPADIASGVYRELVEQMRKDMVAANGVGLAANQVGQDIALFVIDKKLADEHNVPDAYFNPDITEYSREEDEMEEGCLSIPKYYVPVKRPKKIMFKALGPDGKKIKFRARGWLARVLQHETDHLNGVVIKDRVHD
jgi:peptide deformylase